MVFKKIHLQQFQKVCVKERSHAIVLVWVSPEADAKTKLSVHLTGRCSREALRGEWAERGAEKAAGQGCGMGQAGPDGSAVPQEQWQTEPACPGPLGGGLKGSTYLPTPGLQHCSRSVTSLALRLGACRGTSRMGSGMLSVGGMCVGH